MSEFLTFGKLETLNEEWGLFMVVTYENISFAEAVHRSIKNMLLWMIYLCIKSLCYYAFS